MDTRRLAILRNV